MDLAWALAEMLFSSALSGGFAFMRSAHANLAVFHDARRCEFCVFFLIVFKPLESETALCDIFFLYFLVSSH